MRYAFVVVFWILFVPLTGCFSYTTLHTATPVEKSKLEVNLAPGAFGIGNEGDSLTVPTTELALRYGVSDDLDMGVKAFFFGTALDLNYALVNDSGLAVSVNPYISVSRLGAAFSEGGETSLVYGVMSVNALLDLKPSDRVTLTAGLKPSWLYAVGETGGNLNAATGFAAGGMLGLQLRLTDEFAVMPSVDVLIPVAQGVSGGLFSSGVGFMFLL